MVWDWMSLRELERLAEALGVMESSEFEVLNAVQIQEGISKAKKGREKETEA